MMNEGEEGMMVPGNVLSGIHSLLRLITQLWEAGTARMPTFWISNLRLGEAQLAQGHGTRKRKSGGCC